MALTFISCASSKISMSPRGAMATVTLSDGTERTVELLALQDSLVLLAPDSLMVVPPAGVRRLFLHLEQRRAGWLALVTAVEVVPTIVILARSDYDIEDRLPLGITGLALTVGTVAAFHASEPQESFTWPLTAEEIEELRLRSRYPYGITPAQLEQLRRSWPPGR
jgi:hypothetical protein